MKPKHQEQLLTDYFNTHLDIMDLLDEIKNKITSEYPGPDDENVHYGHLGDLLHIKATLKEIVHPE
jgi:hypothetical protein